MDWLNENVATVGLRGVAGVVGGLLLLAGARLYPLAIMAPGLLAGLALGLVLPPEVDTPIRIVAALVVAVVGALLCRFVERVAVAGFGAVVTAGVGHLGYPLAMGEPSPIWVAPAAALVGLLLFPRAFKLLLIPLTALLGAMSVSVALGVQENLLAVGGLAAAGVVAQLLLRKKKKTA